MSHPALEGLKHVADVTAPVITVGSMLAYLPYWAAGFTILWTGMRMYDWIEAKIDNSKGKKDA